MISRTSSDRSGMFGQSAARAAEFAPPLKPALKAQDTYSVIGTAQPRFDLPSKVNGTAMFGMDVLVPHKRRAGHLEAYLGLHDFQTCSSAKICIDCSHVRTA
ncbi:hypothetical protein [Roseobacter weihaiensis]|uniref:hypothetical protein n=1 Tax=Roseobacter weihaiensis TaxID=2763262 RepID=UPI001D0A6D72|nr:hypothetical protein [Roseobacter sp. H9]